MAQVSPDRIFEVATGFMASKHLFTANEIGLFGALAEAPLHLDELSKRLNIPSRTVRIIADAMVSLEFLEKEGRKYKNSALSQTFLAGQSPADFRPFLRFWNSISYPLWDKLADAVRQDRPMREKLDPAKEEIFSKGVAAFTAAPARSLAEKYDFSRHRKVLDLGGGVGSFLKAALERHSNLIGTLFDVSEVTTVAKNILTGSSLASRIDIVSGNLLKDSIPTDHDVMILANVVHYFDYERNRMLMKRIRESVSPATRLLIVDFWTNADHTQPLMAALMGGEFLVLQGGDVFSQEEAKEWCGGTGWKYVETLQLGGPLSVVVAESI